MTWHQSMGHKGPVLRPRCIKTKRVQTKLLLYSKAHLQIAPVTKDSSVSIVTKLWSGKSGICGSIPGIGKRLFPHPVSRPALESTQSVI